MSSATAAIRRFEPESIATGSSNRVFRIGGKNEWHVEALKKVLGYRALQPNWDSYGSQPICQNAIDAAIWLLGMIPFDNVPTPRIVPVSGGGFQFDWSRGGRELEVEVRPDGSIEILKIEGGVPLDEGSELSSPETDLEMIFGWLIAG